MQITPTLALTATGIFVALKPRGCMRRLYEPISAVTRARYHRECAVELERRGYPVLAQFHREMVAWLEPPERVHREPRRTAPVDA